MSNLRKPSTGTDIHLSQADGEFVRVFVNGELVAEVFGGKAQTALEWEDKLRHARTLCSLPRMLTSFVDRLRTIINREDHNFPKPDAKVTAYIAGFADGMCGITAPHPMGEMIPRMQRDYSPCFSEGFEHGQAVSKAASLTNRV